MLSPCWVTFWKKKLKGNGLFSGTILKNMATHLELLLGKGDFWKEVLVVVWVGHRSALITLPVMTSEIQCNYPMVAFSGSLR